MNGPRYRLLGCDEPDERAQDLQRCFCPVAAHLPELLGDSAPRFRDFRPGMGIVHEFEVPAQTIDRKICAARQCRAFADNQLCMQHRRSATQLCLCKRWIESAKLDDASFNSIHRENGAKVSQVDD